MIFSTLVDDKQRISFGLRLDNDPTKDDDLKIKINVKLFSADSNAYESEKTRISQGELVLEIFEQGRQMRLSLDYSLNNVNIQIQLTNWTSVVNENGYAPSVMDNDWHHVEITFHRHKTFSLTVDHRSQQEQVTFSIENRYTILLMIL